MALFDQIQAAPDTEIREVPVEEWGFPIFVRSCTALVRSEVEQRCAEFADNGDRSQLATMRTWFLARTLCDADGALLKEDPEAVQRMLEGKNGNIINRIWQEAWELNGFAPEDLEEEKKD